MLRKSKNKEHLSIQPGLPGRKSYEETEFYHLVRAVDATIGGGSVAIYRKKRDGMRGAPKLIEEFSIADAYKRTHFQAYLRTEFGDGVYMVNVYGEYGEVIGEFEFAIGDGAYSEQEDVDEQQLVNEEMSKIIIEILKSRK